MKADEMMSLLKMFNWGVLGGLYGLGHNTIIGFISCEWMSRSSQFVVLDGAPAAVIGEGRSGQTNADAILCYDDRPAVAVEVESVAENYAVKLESLSKYFSNCHDYDGLEYGMLVMLNLRTNVPSSQRYVTDDRQFEALKESARARTGGFALLSIEKRTERMGLQYISTPLAHLRMRNDYYPWRVNRVIAWVKDAAGGVDSGRIWEEGF